MNPLSNTKSIALVPLLGLAVSACGGSDDSLLERESASTPEIGIEVERREDRQIETQIAQPNDAPTEQSIDEQPIQRGIEVQPEEPAEATR